MVIKKQQKYLFPFLDIHVKHLTKHMLRERVSYSTYTGVFYAYDNVKKDQVPCHVFFRNKTPYITVPNTTLKVPVAHLAWLYVHGSLPDYPLEYLDGNKSNCRIANLRLKTPESKLYSLAHLSASRVHSSAFEGVSFYKRTGRWRARNLETGMHLGYFETEIDAANAIVADRRNKGLSTDGRRGSRKNLYFSDGMWEIRIDGLFYGAYATLSEARSRVPVAVARHNDRIGRLADAS